MVAAERREALLQAALPLFARRGLHGTGTRELAAAAGVTEPILYRHFPGKEALYLAVLERATQALTGVLERCADTARGRGAAARLGALADGLSQALSEHPDALRVLVAAAAALDQPDVADAARRHLRALADLLAGMLREAGLRRGVDPAVAGGLLLEVGLGASVLWPVGVPVALRDDFRPAVLALLVRALAR
jgi:AcrR family transcriptional regulator